MSSDATPTRVQRTEVDGVPVFWTDTPGRLGATLLFGVGMADETFLTTGITHLVEHMTMRRLGTFPHAANACVGISFTSFEVSSSPPVVASHLRQVCLALADPDLTGLDVERRVLGAEEHSHDSSTIGWWPLALRYGSRGPGLAGNRQLAPHLAGPDDVRDWCRRWFHRGNAALMLDGPPPPDLVLPLPDGPPVRHPAYHVIDLPTPAWTEGPPGGVLVALHGPWSAELATGLSVLGERLTRTLRHEAGLVYDLGSDITHLRGGMVAIGLGTEVPDQHVWTVVDRLLDTFDQLCADGPDDDELAHDRDSLRECLADPDLAVEDAMGAALERVTGIPGGTDDRARVLAGLRADDVAAALRTARASLIVGTPPGHALHRLPELPVSTVPPVEGRALARARLGSGAPRGAQLVVGAEGLSLFLARGAEPMTVRFVDVVAVGTEPARPNRDDDELFVIIAGSGETVLLRERDWRDGRSAVDALRSAVPAEFFYPQPAGMRLLED